MKTSYWIILVVVLVLILGYLGRHRIRTMLSGGATPQPSAETQMAPALSPSPEAMVSSIVTTKTDPTKGSYLADPKGMTLYSFDKDSKGVSTCNGSCSSTWPPYLEASSSALSQANVTVVKRTDGTMMYAYNGMPLYYYVKDTKPGDLMGDGVGGLWHLVKP